MSLRVERVDAVASTVNIARSLPQMLGGGAELELVEHPVIEHGGPLAAVDRLPRRFVAEVLSEAQLRLGNLADTIIRVPYRRETEVIPRCQLVIHPRELLGEVDVVDVREGGRNWRRLRGKLEVERILEPLPLGVEEEERLVPTIGPPMLAPMMSLPLSGLVRHPAS